MTRAGMDKVLDRGYDVTASGCWEYRGHRNNLGYGQIRFGRGPLIRVHRISFEFHNGPIPPGGVIMHACDNPPCINPAHLSVGTQSDNVKDASAKGRLYKQDWTECPNGHPYVSSNVIVGGNNKCRQCVSDRNARYHQRKKANSV